MMNKLFVIIILIILISCQNIVEEKEEIKNVNICINIEDDFNNSLMYHLFIKNTDDKNKSIGINLENINDKLCISLFPGIYDFYVYGLVEKSSTKKMVKYYSVKINEKIYTAKDIILNLIELIPDPGIVIEKNGEDVRLIINKNKLLDLFSISSISLKQGSDRSRSLKLYYDENLNSYIASVILYENGDWYFNISYSLRSSYKYDEVFISDDIKLSTSYFSNNYLGEYNFL